MANFLHFLHDCPLKCWIPATCDRVGNFFRPEFPTQNVACCNFEKSWHRFCKLSDP